MTKISGFILIVESLFIFVSAGVSYCYGEWDFNGLSISGGLVFFAGAIFMAIGMKDKNKKVTRRESYLAVTFSWILFAFFGAIPFYISGAIPSYTDAFFETMSGLTTTGASILTHIENMPHGLLFWRSLTQWLGGMGVIVFSISVLPLLGGEASQLYEAETTGLTRDKFRPRIAQVAKRLWMIYFGLTLAAILLFFIGPMNLFDSVCQAFTTVSTGGFSTKQKSLAYWNSPYIETVAIIFMLVGAINFSTLYYLAKGNFKKFSKDEELKWYLGIIIVATLLVTFALVKDRIITFNVRSVRENLFQIVSILTTTGFSTENYSSWGPFYSVLFLILMCICGCAGSTSGGLKTVRFAVLVKTASNEFKRLLHPQAVIPVRMNGKVLPAEMVHRLLAFATLFISIIIFSWIVLTLDGMSFEDSLGAVITSISNVGPGLGSNGPFGSFSGLSEFAKWYLSLLMLIGRLEIFTVLILFTPSFWKK